MCRGINGPWFSREYCTVEQIHGIGSTIYMSPKLTVSDTDMVSMEVMMSGPSMHSRLGLL